MFIGVLGDCRCVSGQSRGCLRDLKAAQGNFRGLKDVIEVALGLSYFSLWRHGQQI